MRPARRQQVAAVCYRTGTRGIEFLLVRTRRGRWIFPKGGVEAGLTQAQSAALEAFEEAGVHGRIEEMPFARYRLAKTAASGADGDTVTAHLCEVSHLEAPQEAYRTPTWFVAHKAKRRLAEKRDATLAGQFASVVDRAVSRIRRLEVSAGKDFHSDGLRKVRFEAFENGQLPRARDAALLRRLFLDPRRPRPAETIEVEADPIPARRRKNYVH